MSLFHRNKKSKNDYPGDLNKTSVLDQLFKVPKEHRNEHWKKDFLENITHAGLRTATPQVILGPDGFPYFQLLMPIPDQRFECFVLEDLITNHLLENGFGVVINPDKDEPDWVFTYGDILSYHLYKEYCLEHSGNQNKTDEVIKKDTQVFTGNPSENFLPSSTRRVLRNHLNKLNVHNVKIFLMFRPETKSQDLVFNITPEKFTNRHDFDVIMKIISWYMPRHYSIVGISEEGKEIDFYDL